ncbi:MAG: DksA/TraR family C4-type zinc finger protein [Geminicoccaceae bacterium]|nr:DksA/TraR family C4-type zinc finger protein [Geminicoccaceae bacterium]
MAGGWTRDGAVQEQIDDTVGDAVRLARGRLPTGESLEHCESCEAPIPEGRRRAIPGVRLCVDCQAEADGRVRARGLYNRRGSKDSQLR